MAKGTRTHIGDSTIGNDDDVLAPKYLTKEQFGRRVYKLMIAKNWRQSELARRADLGRDAVSTYVTGRSYPSPQNLEKLAKALGVAPEELLPNVAQEAIQHDRPDFELKTSAGDPTKAWLKIDRMVSLATAVKIAELIQADGKPTE